jgi:hypothetical protein
MQVGKMRAIRSTVITLVVSGLLAVVACDQQSPEALGGSPELNKALVRRWIEVGFNERNPLVVDDLFTEQVIINGQVSVGMV